VVVKLGLLQTVVVLKQFDPVRATSSENELLKTYANEV